MADELTLGQRFREGDEQAFRELFTELSDKVFRYFLVKTKGHRDESENLTQEAFMRAWKSRHTFDPERSFTSWIFGIAHRVYVDSIRRADFELSFEEELTVPDRGVTVEERAHEKLLLEKIFARLQDFPKDSRDILIMTYIGGLNSDEVAKILGKSPSAVRMSNQRTISKVKESFEGESNE